MADKRNQPTPRRSDKAPTREVRNQDKGKESSREAVKVVKGIINSIRNRTN
jgi:hypothetical protein